MNTVITAREVCETLRLRDLTGFQFDPKRTAFVGWVGKIKPENPQLFLINYSGILLASDPYQSWTIYNNAELKVHVREFVDVEIRVRPIVQE